MSTPVNTFSSDFSFLKDVKSSVYIKGEPLVFNSLVLRQSLNSCHFFEVTEDFLGREDLVSKKSPNSLSEFVGERIHIVFQHESKKYEFVGFITEVEMDSWERPQSISYSNCIRYKGKGAICMLDDVPSMFSFTDYTLADIVRELTSDYQSHFSTHCNPNFKETLAFAMQYKESVFAFLNRLSSLYNELFFYDGKELHFGTPTTNEQEELTFDEDLISLKTAVQTLPSMQSYYDYFSANDTYMHSQSVIEPERRNMVLTPLISRKEALYKAKGILASPSSNRSEGGLDEVLQGQYNATLGKMHVIEGKTKTSRVKIGGLVRVHFSSHYDLGNEIGVYRVVSVEHRVDKSGSYENHFVAVPQGLEYSLFSPQTIAYPEIAEVVSNEDPKGQGRVQVQFYWQKHNGLRTNWLRVQSLDAGVLSDGSTNRGVAFIPEVGDQVMVSFEQGDPHRPYVSGSMFHKGNAVEMSNNIRSITTKSGHTIVFDDTKDAEKITIKDRDGSVITFDTKQKSLLVQSVETMEFSAKNIKLNAEENVEITTQQDVLINSKSKLMVNTELDMELVSKTNIGLQSEENLTLKSNDLVAIEATSKTTIQADTTLLQGTNLTELSGEKIKLKGESLAELMAQLVKIN
ncbi:phage baseplate assembly protein V [Capnocytophaga cynodegmi]|uniref:Phage-like baseplate assembly protein n=1 Tax=Capnocytophaga cynodegmi TaxID=28189 RepID=A0A0B7H826_9FLAO|nr:phage baseplate assembly protein V [Capnocytophaga cynodegmi]CEN35746.1 Phage-like baseplate assembly protein [Capnocytophaga cynodegmi]